MEAAAVKEQTELSPSARMGGVWCPTFAKWCKSVHFLQPWLEPCLKPREMVLSSFKGRGVRCC